MWKLKVVLCFYTVLGCVFAEIDDIGVMLPDCAQSTSSIVPLQSLTTDSWHCHCAGLEVSSLWGTRANSRHLCVHPIWKLTYTLCTWYFML